MDTDNRESEDLERGGNQVEGGHGRKKRGHFNALNNTDLKTKKNFL